MKAGAIAALIPSAALVTVLVCMVVTVESIGVILYQVQKRGDALRELS